METDYVLCEAGTSVFYT